MSSSIIFSAISNRLVSSEQSKTPSQFVLLSSDGRQTRKDDANPGDGTLIRDEFIATQPAYMLIKLKHDVGVEIDLPGLPRSIVGIVPMSLTYKAGLGKAVTYPQFPVTLAYTITDYKCQRQTSRWVVVDIKKLNGGYSPTSSPYVQLSRPKTLASLSILCPFDAAELRTPLSKDLMAELEWQAQKAKETEDLYM